MGRTFEYPKQGHNTVHRHGHDRGRYDLGFIHSLINSSLILNVSFTPSAEDEFPTILPMIGVMGSFENPSAGIDEPLDCYIHGYVSSRLSRLGRDAEAKGKPGFPICISASRVDGIVLAYNGFSHSYNYRSAVLFGYANAVTDPEEITYAMKLITDKVVANRTDHTRQPTTKAEVTSTTILKVSIKSGSGKQRDVPNSDPDHDMQDSNMRSRVWVGYMPVTELLGEPVPAVYNQVKDVPEYITQYRDEFNDSLKDYAEAIVDKVRTGQE